MLAITTVIRNIAAFCRQLWALAGELAGCELADEIAGAGVDESEK